MKPWSLAVVALALAASPAAAQYEIAWWTVDGGGVTGATGGTYTLSGTIGQPDAGGPYTGAPYTLHSGFWALIAGGSGGPQADLSISKNDGITTAVPGQIVSYTIAAMNAGPTPVTAAAVSDTIPATLTGASWTCTASAGSSCPGSGSGSIAASVNLLVGGTAAFTLTGTIAPIATGSLANTASIAVPAGIGDPNNANNSDTDTDTLTPLAQPPKAELSHGTRLFADLAAVGATPDVDLYRIDQQPYSSYEIVVDATSGDIGLGSGPTLALVGADGTTLVQSSQPVGVGPSRSLRLVNSSSTAIEAQLVRVASASCGSDCGTDDVYRLRTWETTATIPRFNNSASQITVIVLQNRGAEPVSGVMYFWSPSGALVHQQPLSLAAHAGLSLNTAGISALAGQGGSVTIAHDGSYDALVGKGVAVEPATGFAFDSVLTSRMR